jgi:hypothetical protein
MGQSEVQRGIHKILQEKPGTSKQWIADAFGLSTYRLNKVFRCIERDLNGVCIAHEPGKGLWLVEFDPANCSGMVWVGVNEGGFRQCGETALLPDGRCYSHSQYECAEMVALARRINYLAGPGEPCVRSLSMIAEHILQELLADLGEIRPVTLVDQRNRTKFHRILSGALSFRQWKQLNRKQSVENEIPFEFMNRQRNSYRNYFQVMLRKYFLLLRIPDDSGKEEVLKAWKKLALLYHPDLHGEDGDEDMMKSINEAKDRIFSVKGWD